MFCISDDTRPHFLSLLRIMKPLSFSVGCFTQDLFLPRILSITERCDRSADGVNYLRMLIVIPLCVMANRRCIAVTDGIFMVFL